MRLVCPNCEAKYEVPEDAIPETGRDVQCANCGHAWYQMRPRAAGVEAAPAAAPEPVAASPAAAPEPAAPESSKPEPSVAEVPAAVTEAEPVVHASAAAVAEGASASAVADAPVAATVPDPEPVADSLAEVLPEVTEPVAEAVETVTEAVVSAPVSDAVEAVAETVAATAPADPVPSPGSAGEIDDAETDPGPAPAVAAATDGAPAGYAVDESVLAILREEAEREAEARRAEAGKPLEVQADLGIDAAMPSARKPVEVISAEASNPVEAGPAEEKLEARRTRLPDVEEIKSTLRPSEHAVAEDVAVQPMPVAAAGGGSFRSGFLLVMTVAILGMALYISADALASAVPALAGVLEAYVGFVNSLRLRLDGLMQSATVAINGSGA